MQQIPNINTLIILKLLDNGKFLKCGAVFFTDNNYEFERS